jgi:hypothetical protein
LRDFLADFFGAFLIDVENRYGRAARREFQRYRPSNTAASAGDHGGLAIQAKV